MPITKLSPVDADKEITEWTAAVETLFQQVQHWAADARSEDWQITFSTADVTEESLGSYPIRVMEINAGTGRLILEPVGLDVLGARGRVDLYAWPSLFRVMLLRSLKENNSKEGWTIRTESGIDWPTAWGKDSFLVISEQLLAAS